MPKTSGTSSSSSSSRSSCSKTFAFDGTKNIGKVEATAKAAAITTAEALDGDCVVRNDLRGASATTANVQEEGGVAQAHGPIVELKQRWE